MKCGQACIIKRCSDLHICGLAGWMSALVLSSIAQAQVAWYPVFAASPVATWRPGCGCRATTLRQASGDTPQPAALCFVHSRGSACDSTC